MPCKEKLKNPYKEPTLREWHENMKKMRENGLKPFLKGSRGRVKLEFEQNMSSEEEDEKEPWEQFE